ncbi:MAG: hypothetical protein U1F54_06710 [Burkholderiales bacterium]
MSGFSRLWPALLFAMAAGASHAMPGTWEIVQVFSNADGTIQFIDTIDFGIQDCDSGEEFWAGFKLTSNGPAGTKVYVFPQNLPTCHTSRKHVLIATQGFAALGVVAPDYVIPNGFLSLTAGSVELALVSSASWAALPTDGVTAVDATGKPRPNLATNLAGASASIVAPAFATVVEYYNAALDHYFITWVAAEVALLDEGVKIKGWARTGSTFRVHTAPQAATSPVCRFYIPPALGDSHFFGRGTAECTATKTKFPELVLEDDAFMHLTLPQSGACPAGTRNVYRVFSNRADANHRYMTDAAIRDAMKARGWTPEGDGPDLVVMCAPA